MSNPNPTPEALVLSFTAVERQELLSALSLDASQEAAEQLKRLVKELESFERAIERMSQPNAASFSSRKAA